MGKYLTDNEIERASEQLYILYALPFANDLLGTAWEQILANIKGGSWTGKRDNRARPDITVPEGGTIINYSVKIESPKITASRRRANDLPGYHEDFIVARPKVDELFRLGETIASMDVNELGARVLGYYNEQIIKKYQWDVIAFLLHLKATKTAIDFIYWEERPPTRYNPDDYWWRDSGRATGGNRNINGYPKFIDQHTEVKLLPPAKFKWTSGGKQFYIRYDIPQDADIWSVEKADLSLEEVLAAVKELLRKKQQSE